MVTMERRSSGCGHRLLGLFLALEKWNVSLLGVLSVLLLV